MSAVATRTGHGGTVVWLVAGGIALAALNLRTAVTSIGPVLDQLSAGLHMSGAVTGLLTTLPVLCFAIFGALTPALSRRLGQHNLLLAALILLAGGQALRSLVDSIVPFLAASIVALAGAAVGNVVIPSLIKRHFPQRDGAMMIVYATALAMGTMVAASATVPVERMSGGDWHVALGVWAALAAVAAIPWLALARSEPERTSTRAHRAKGGLLRSKLAWAVAGYFGSQSLIAYVMFGWLPLVLTSHGYSEGQSAIVIALFTGLGIPLGIVVPALATRVTDQRPLVASFAAMYAVGFIGLLSGRLMWLAAIAAAIGMSSFPLGLVMLALRTRTAAATAELSAFGQSLGYLIAGIGPITFGLLRDMTGGWAAPFAMLFVVLTVNAVTGWYAGTDRKIEDEWGPSPAAHSGTRGEALAQADGDAQSPAR
jgi:MFS transporter, CP family, cyanate transporter